MNELLARFQAQTHRKADPDLIARWEWEARFYGERDIKALPSKAKRTATTMRKMREEFTKLKPEHELAMKAAESSLRVMAEEYTALAAWAKDYGAFCAAERQKEEDARLESLAQSRWGSSDQACQFERELMEELGTRDGKETFARWCHSVGKYTAASIEQISCTVERLRPGPSPRIRTILTVEEGMTRRVANVWNSPRGLTVIGSWSDYEEYLAYRKEVARKSAHIVALAGRPA